MPRELVVGQGRRRWHEDAPPSSRPNRRPTGTVRAGRAGSPPIAAHRACIADFGKDALAAAAARPGEHVIDIGCGIGGTTAELARAVGPTGHVLGVDISEPLIEAARVAPGRQRDLRGRRCGHPSVQGGVLRSRLLALRRHVLRRSGGGVPQFPAARSSPTGRLVFLCWRTPQENPWGLVPLRAAAAVPAAAAAARAGGSRPVFLRRSRPGRAHPEGGGLRRASHRAARPADLDGQRPSAEVARTMPAASARWRAPSPTPSRRRSRRRRPAIAEALEACTAGGRTGVMLPGACWLVQRRRAAQADGAHPDLSAAAGDAWCWAARARARARTPRSS